MVCTKMTRLLRRSAASARCGRVAVIETGHIGLLDGMPSE